MLERNTLIGILAGLTTGALWGLTFVAPRVVAPYSAWDLTVARYGIFGIASVLLMLHPRLRPSGLSLMQVVKGLVLGGAGYVGYFVSAAYAVRLAGAALPPLVIGTMPVVLAVVANVRDHSVRWRSLAVPLASIAAGVGIVDVAVVEAAGAANRADIGRGVLCAGIALAIWVVYGMVNSSVMRAPKPPDALHWTGLQGIGAALGSLVLLPLTTFGRLDAVSPADSGRFLIWALIMGLAASWLATWCWVVASRKLPLVLSAQLIVSETVFGLIGGFVFEARWPRLAEWIGAALQLIGVGAAIGLLSEQAHPQCELPTALLRPARRGAQKTDV